MDLSRSELGQVEISLARDSIRLSTKISKLTNHLDKTPRNHRTRYDTDVIAGLVVKKREINMLMGKVKAELLGADLLL